MLVVLVLVCGGRRVTQAGDVRLRRVSVVSNDLALHSADASMVRVQLPSLVRSRGHALAHLKERVHLRLVAHLVTKDAVCAHVVWLM